MQENYARTCVSTISLVMRLDYQHQEQMLVFMQRGRFQVLEFIAEPVLLLGTLFQGALLIDMV